MQTYAEQIAAYEAKRASSVSAMNDIMTKSAEKGETLDAADQESFDTHERDIDAIDGHLKRLKVLDKQNIAAATPVTDVRSGDEASRLRTAFGSVAIQSRPEKGVAFVRLLAAKYLAGEQHCAPWDIAKRWTDTPEVETILRAAVAVGSTTDATFAAPLVVNVVGEFIDLLRAKEVIGRIQGLDRVPFNQAFPRGTADPTAYWVGQGDVKPVSRSAFDTVTLLFNKVAGIVPMTVELMKFSNPSAELKVRDGLTAAIAYLTDRDFLDPSKALVTGVSPASITNGVTPTVATGTTADAFRDDFGTMMSAFSDANEDPDGITIVMNSSRALKLGLMRNSLGGKEFPDIGMRGGTIEGFPVVTTTNIAATGGSPTDGDLIVAVNAPNILLAEEGVEIDISREASLQMDSSPDSPETASTVTVSLWQRNLVAIKAERFITWGKKHSTSVQYIASAKYQ